MLNSVNPVKETVQDLMNSERLKAAVGGLPTYTPTCGVSCYYYETCFGC